MKLWSSCRQSLKPLNKCIVHPCSTHFQTYVDATIILCSCLINACAIPISFLTLCGFSDRGPTRAISFKSEPENHRVFKQLGGNRTGTALEEERKRKAWNLVNMSTNCYSGSHSKSTLIIWKLSRLSNYLLF